MSRRSTHRLAALVAATLVAAAGLVGLQVGPAAAATCSGGGVSAVVDFHSLGGGVRTGCDGKGASHTAREVFKAAGFSLVDAPTQRGFVCLVDGKPSSGRCQGTTSYWGLFWSDGKSGRWNYSTVGVDGLTVPSGGFVALSWQSSQSKAQPGVRPVNAKPAPAPKPSAKPTPTPTKAPGGKPGGSTGGGTGSTQKPTPTPTKAVTTPGQQGSSQQADSEQARAQKTEAQKAEARKARARKAKARKARASTPTASASATPTEGATPSPSGSTTLEPSADSSPLTGAQKTSGDLAPAEQSSGLPTWVPIAVIAVLAAAAGGAVWLRRRTGA